MVSEKIRKVRLVPYNSDWAIQFQEESLKICKVLGSNFTSIHHIGSTAIPDIYAKPVIDSLLVVNDLSKIDGLNPAFEKLGYACMGEYGISGRRFYWKGKNKRTHHIHLFEQGHPEIARHLAFRDYLRKHPDTAQGYSLIKRCLADQFPNDIEAYLSGKESFIRMIDYRTGTAKEDQLKARDDIFLMDYDPKWVKLAAAEIRAICETAKLPFIVVEHLGSTSIEGLDAKPVIDIFIALDNINEAKQWIKPLEALGYTYWAENPDKSHQRYFKGMPPFGIRRTHHVHIMQMGEEFERRVAFRDLLRKDIHIRQQYQALKHQLAQEYPEDRESYTEAKSKFIVKVLSVNQQD